MIRLFACRAGLPVSFRAGLGNPFILFGFALMPIYTSAADLPMHGLRLPAGFQIEVWVDEIANARQMALGEKGTLFVGSRSAGKVYAVPNIEGQQDKRVLQIASGLRSPSGIAFKDGDLYVADIDKIYRYADIEDDMPNWPEPELFFDGLPSETHHGWKNIAFGPEGDLYIPIGAPCNICDPGEPYAAIHRLDMDSRELISIARGVRNTVGFDWHPQTDQLWFTDNGRDHMGDDLPPCEINVLTEEGQHFGYPYLHGSGVADPEYAADQPGDLQISLPARDLGAHVAPLGLHFYQGQMFPQEYRNRILVAEHGSWNRSDKIGYRIMIGQIEGEEVVDYRPFIDGWLLPGNLNWGRPVAFEGLADGSVLISDDYAGVIYRLSYTAN